ncbi:MAG: hypothetical protein ACHQO8_14370 [Vicinamibacterales bacterium]
MTATAIRPVESPSPNASCASRVRPAPYACATAEPEEEAHAEDGDRVEQAAANADGAERLGPDAADEHGVDEPHRHPPELGDDDRAGETQESAELGCAGRR